MPAFLNAYRPCLAGILFNLGDRTFWVAFAIRLWLCVVVINVLLNVHFGIKLVIY